MKKRLLSSLLALMMVCTLLPTAVFAEEVTNIDDLYITDLSRPAFGQKLDYDLTLRTNPADTLITEGEKAPVLEWYAYNDYTGSYEPVTDPGYVGDARAYMLYITMYPTENCQFNSSYEQYSNFWLNGQLLDEKSDYTISKLDENGICLGLFLPMRYDEAHTIKTVTFTDMPYNCVVGDRVDAFTPATLKDDGKSGKYFWYLEKLDDSGNTLGMYIPKAQEDTALELIPGLTRSDIAELRQDFGTTFKSGYYYVLNNIQLLSPTYTYHWDATVKATFRNGETFSRYFDSQPDDYYDKTFIAACVFSVLLETIEVTTPSAPTLNISKTDGKIKLSWNTVPGADKYWVYRCTDGVNFKYYDMTTNTSYTNSSVTSGTKYYYKVKAVNTMNGKDYISSFSNAKSTIPLTTPTLNVALSAGAAKLSWGAVTGATKYWIYRSTDGVNFKYYDSTTKTSYTNSSVSGGSTYYYKVKALKAVGSTDWTSDYSAAKSVKILKAPTLSISKTDGKVKLSWNAVDGAVKYWIYRSTDGVNFKYYDMTTKTSYTNSSVTSGTKYYYKVKAVNSNDGTSVYSSAKSTVPLTTPTLSISKTDGKIKLSWGAVTGATKYWIYRSTDGVNFKYYDTTTKTSYTNSSVTSGTKYYYKVRAVKTVNGTDWTSDYSAAKSTIPLTTPTLSISKTDGKIKLSWGAVTGATKYWIYRSTDGVNFSYYDSTTNTSYTNSSVTAGKTYYYKVKAVKTVNGTDWTSDYSAAKSGILPATDRTTPATTAYVLNIDSMKFHYSGCSSAERISAENRQESNLSRSELIALGYEPCQNCNP